MFVICDNPPFEKIMPTLALFLLVSCADNLRKLFGNRSGLTKCLTWSGNKLFDTLVWYS